MATSRQNNYGSRIPPHDEMAEKAVLGGVLIDNQSLTEIAKIIQPQHFYYDKHNKIYTSIINLFDKSEPIDLVTVAAQLKEEKVLNDIGGPDYLAELIDATPTSAYVKHYAEIVKNTYIKRTLIHVASELVQESFDDGGEVQELLNKAESSIFALSQAFLHRDFVALRDILAISFERLERFMKEGNKTRGLPTGFNGVDKKLAGLQESNLIILAARPGVGKTTFALNMAMHIALNEKAPIGFFSLEMSKEELVDRLLVGQADIDAWALKTGKLSDDDYSRLTQAMGELSEAPIYIDDTPGASILEMRTKARKMKIEKDLKLIIVDYLQLAVAGKKMDSRVQEVGYISQNLKNIARELNVPVIALSQLNRTIEHRTEKKPQLADLRESGCLTGDTLITLADTGKQVRIDSLVGKSNFNVWSIDENQKVKSKHVSKVFSTGIKPVYELKLRTGRKIKATGNHKFMLYNSWNRLDSIKIGQRIAIPRHITQPRDKNLEFSDEHLIFLAHMIGDGCFVKRQPIHYTSNTLEHISVVNKQAKALFNIDGRVVEQESWYHTYLPSPYKLTHKKYHPFRNWLLEIGLDLSRADEKSIPEGLYSCNEDQIALFLKHLWATDGCLNASKSVKIYYATSSEVLADGVQKLLLRIGIKSTIHTIPQKKGTKKFKPSYHVDIQGKPDQISFLKKVGAFGNKRTYFDEALIKLHAIKTNPNTDILDASVWDLLIKPEKSKLQDMTWRKFQDMLGIKYCGSTLFKNGIGRKRLSKIAKILESEKLLMYAESDLYWDEVIDIKECGEEKVYDMTVPETHNFIAQDIVVHNSIEQDADVVMFLYAQDEDNDLIDTTKRPMNLLIAKHRNGPTGEVPLIFRGDRVRFFDVDSSVDEF